jgi:diguanylate cyclase (GGDEF)-like protein/PAS domain S-box-containing protein
MTQKSEGEQLRQPVVELQQKDELHKHILEELKKIESRLKETERLANIGSWEMDITTGKSFWSDGFYRIIGIDPNEVEPSAEIGMQIIHPDDRERAANEVQKAISEGHEYDIEKRIVRPDGEVRTVLSRGVIILAENNNPSKLVGAFLDITEQKKAAEEILNLNAQLEQRVAERTKELEEANKKLQLISVTDALTGVHNRRFFNETIYKEWRRAIRSKETLSLIMIDIDFFKAYNDFNGHLVGDQCLHKVAVTLKKALNRTSDVFVRYGGEEFAVLLPATELPGAKKVAEAMKRNIEQLNLPHKKSLIAQYLTVSMGIASILPKKEIKVTALIEMADGALYEAKRKGRNQIIIN